MSPTAFVLFALLGSALALVELEDVEPSLLDGKAALAAGKPEQELIQENGLDEKAWGHVRHSIWPDSECRNIGMRGPEMDGTHLALDECKEMCLTMKGCNAYNYNAEKVFCVMRNCKEFEHPTNHNTWDLPGWIGYRLKMTKPEIEAALEALDLPADPEENAEDTEAGAFADADAAEAEKEAIAGDAAKEASYEKEEEVFTEEEDPAFLAAQAEAAKEEAAKKKADSVKEQEKKFEEEQQAAEEEAAKKAAAAIEAAAQKEAAKKKAAAEAAAAKEAAAKKAEAAAKKAEAAAKLAAEKEASKKKAEAAAAKEAAAKKKAEKEKAAAAAAAAIEAAAKKEAAKKAAQPVAPPPFSYADAVPFSNCYASTAEKSSANSFRNGVRFSVSPPLPEGIKLDSKTGTISGTYKTKTKMKKGQKGVVKDMGFTVTAARSGMETTHHFKMKLEESHCSAQPPYMLAVVAAVLLLLCLLCFFCRSKGNSDETKYVPLKSGAEGPARIKQITANEHPTEKAPRPAHITPAKPTPVPPTAAASTSLAAFAGDPVQTWTLKGAQQPKGQSSRFADEEALAGQVGCTSTWKLTPGVPLTFRTPTGEVVTVFALKKPLQLAYDQHRQPIEITRKEDGHGTDLGIDIGWILSGIGYEDITGMPYAEADRLLHEKIGQLPGAIPLTFKRNNGEIKTTYAYHRPLGLTFNQCLPIKITAEEPGHHAEQIGIKVGWELLAVNYVSIQGMTDFDQVAKILVREVGTLPSDA